MQSCSIARFCDSRSGVFAVQSLKSSLIPEELLQLFYVNNNRQYIFNICLMASYH